MHVDLGTGDGAYLAALARRQRETLFIGVDPNHAALIGVARAALNAARAESNLLFVLGSWQDLPGELAGVASRISVLFPWGSLLQAAATADGAFATALGALSTGATSVEIVTAIEPSTDSGELRRLQLESFSPPAMAEALRGRGFTVAQTQLGPDHEYQTSWWRRIRHRPGRVATVTRLTLPGSASPLPAETPHSR